MGVENVVCVWPEGKTVDIIQSVIMRWTEGRDIPDICNVQIYCIFSITNICVLQTEFVLMY